MNSKRFRRKPSGRRGVPARRVRWLPASDGQTRWSKFWIREWKARWESLAVACPDRASRDRLQYLSRRLTGRDRGARESALAELELATLLTRAGFGVSFLAESHARSPDLACELREARLVVEVTALVGSSHARRPADRPSHRREVDNPDVRGGVLIDRMMARMGQKARQLAHASAPVLLAITVPHPDERVADLDLRALSGTATLVLLRLPSMSGVLFSLWDVDPAPATSGIRLANVDMVERSGRLTAYPRIRMLVRNPAARYPFGPTISDALRGLL